MSEKIKIKTGQIWRCKKRNYCIIVGSRLRNDYWKVNSYASDIKSKNGGHRMQEHSFHFYELVEE